MKSTTQARVVAAPWVVVVCAGGCGGAVTSTEANGDHSGQGDSGMPITMGSAGAPNSPSADWTMLGYDLASTYRNRGEEKITKKSVINLEKAWEFDAGGSVTGTPVISSGT